ncbi:hypothetical protein MUB18_12565 [Sphingobacterium sp. PCS056]|uniref:hypothetical protein n=1 Tax=Sphingobacterium TaxID=28453 RepID=UPI00200E9A5B|nr:hypothetical protein [Sphingobacterium sp. PCS056]UPZ34942.1 hypothetical protein MUB18_12565 [Sphingobacterium sp. PCS056]
MIHPIDYSPWLDGNVLLLMMIDRVLIVYTNGTSICWGIMAVWVIREVQNYYLF